MSNPIYDSFSQNSTSNVIQRFQQFRNSFRGNPQEQVQQLLSSGRISQAQYNQAVQQAEALKRILGY